MTLLEYNSIGKGYKNNLQNNSTLTDTPELELPTDLLADFYPNLFSREKIYYFKKYSHRKGDNFHLPDPWFQKFVACLRGRSSRTNRTFALDIKIDDFNLSYLIISYYNDKYKYDIFYFDEPYWKH